MTDSYDKIDRFLRNNLDDTDYAEYSDALDEVLALQPSASAEPVQPLSKYWKITRIDQDRLRVEAEGMASATVSVMSYEPLEMLLASMAEELLAPPATAAREQEADPNAPWLAKAHMLCTDHGISQGHISDRLDKLRDALASATGAEPAAIIETIKAELDTLGRLWMDYGKQAGGFNPESGALYGQIQFTRTKVLDYVAMLATPTTSTTGKVDASRVRDEALSEAVQVYESDEVRAPVGNSAWGEAYQEGWISGAQAYREAIRSLIGTPKSAEGEGA